MGTKRKMSSRGRSGHKSKKGRKGGRVSMRKHRSGRLRQEVKYTSMYQLDQIANRKVGSSTLSVSDYYGLITFPSQGTTDVSRIGDTIMGRKLWVRFTVENVAANNSSCIRVIIFNSKNTALGGSIADFWQASDDNPAITGVVNREVVNKVFYDKVITLNSTIASTRTVFKPINVNIAMRWPIIFSNGGIVPKDPRNRIFMAALVYLPGATADNASQAFLNVRSNFYFTDA